MARFDWLAHCYDIIHKPPMDEIFAVAKPRNTDHVLDIGGGTGVVAAKMQTLVREVCILDPSAKMLAKAKARKVKTFLGSAEEMPFAAKTFDLILCTDAFHHVENKEQALLEMRRVLKPSGRIVFEEYNPATFGGRLIVFIEWLMRFHSKFYTPYKLAKLLNQHGFKTTIRDHNRSYLVKATL